MIHIDYDAVHRLAGVPGLVDALRRAFLAPGTNPERAHYDLEGQGAPRTLLLMPSWQSDRGIGVKIVTVFPDNAYRGLPSVNAAYVLLSWQTGQPRAWIDGRALTLMRTAAVSALAADLLAPAKPEVLLMVGTGALSSPLIQAHTAIRRYQSVLVWGRDPAKAAAVAGDLTARGCPAAAVADLQAAARSADVISCATLAAEPLLQGSWLKPDCHLDLVGSFKPAMREADDACMRDAFIVVDTLAALDDSGDLLGPLAGGVIVKQDVQTLSDLLAREECIARPRRTVFKTVGVALADLAAAEHLFERHGLTRTHANR